MCCRTLRRRVLHHFPLWWARDLWEERPPARSVSSHYYNEGWYPLSRPRTRNNSGHICLWHCFKFSELYLKKKILNHWNSYLINMCDMESWIHEFMTNPTILMLSHTFQKCPIAHYIRLIIFFLSIPFPFSVSLFFSDFWYFAF